VTPTRSFRGDPLPGGGAEGDRPPLPVAAAIEAIVRCLAATVGLLARRRIRQPTAHRGEVISFADRTSARVYRETTVAMADPTDPVALVVEFRLRAIRGRGHALFRAESLLNTPLFVGFPGFVSKLWLAHDQGGRYRGVYEWDGAALAHAYARALWRILALVSERGSIHYVVVPRCTRAQLLAGLEGADPVWWRPVPEGPRATSSS
jgi:hypothetical protein